MTTDGPVERALRDGGVFPPSVMDPHYGSTAAMTRAEIIVKSLEEAGLLPLTEQDSRPGAKTARIASVVANLRQRLPEGEIVTCGAFSALGVSCCNRCHSDPLAGMKLIEAPDGGTAWVCCALAGACSSEPVARCREAKVDPLEGLMPAMGCGEGVLGGNG